MDITEKAKEYAEGKALSSITSAIETAYAEGYKAGFNDCISGEMPEGLDGGVEYVDLGLPSGKKWAKNYLRNDKGYVTYLTHADAQRMNIPSIEDFDEIKKYCKINAKMLTYNLNGQRFSQPCGFYIIGPNGNSISLDFVGYKKADDIETLTDIWLWVKGDKTQETVASGMLISRFSTISVFIGYGLPVILVR